MDEIRLSRRNLIKGITSASIGAALLGPANVLAANQSCQSRRPLRSTQLPNQLMAHPNISGNPTQENFWAQVRDAFPLPPKGEYYHYNTGTTGSQPFYSINNLGVYNLYKSNDPVFWERNLAEDAAAGLFNIPANSQFRHRRSADADRQYVRS